MGLFQHCELPMVWANYVIAITGGNTLFLVLQGAYDNRTIYNSLDLAWSLLRIFPRELLRRITIKTLDEWYDRKEEH